MSVLINFRVDDSLKAEFEKVCSASNSTMTAALTAFMVRAVETHGLSVNIFEEMSYMHALEAAELSDDMQTLAKMARSNDARLREAVARNKHTSAELLDVLGYDNLPEVRLAVLFNPATRSSTIERFLSDNDYTIRTWAKPGLAIKQDNEKVAGDEV